MPDTVIDTNNPKVCVLKPHCSKKTYSKKYMLFFKDSGFRYVFPLDVSLCGEWACETTASIRVIQDGPR